MIRLIVLLIGIVFIGMNSSLHVDEYIQSLEELFLNQTFLRDFQRRTFQLYLDPEYLYGPQLNPFPCSISTNVSSSPPSSVHQLTPRDIQCVAAIGDSLTAGLGAHASTPIGLFTEYRGSSWSIGGDYSFEQLITLPNILREYNPTLKGFSTKSSVIFLKGQNSSHNGLNVAKSGDRSYHMLDQAKILFERLQSNEFCHWRDEWKMITFFVGGNDLCIFCEDYDQHRPERYVEYVNETLNYFSMNFPKTFVNLVLVLDVRNVKELNEGFVCQTLHSRTCPCAAFPSEDETKTLNEWIPRYHQLLIDLINTGIYDQREDFTVVIQPFMAHTKLPRTLDGNPDLSYFAPDCFHFSGKGHSRAALSLWNNLFEPVGSKQWEWHQNDRLQCPTEENPYFYTRINSPQSMEILPQPHH